MCGRYSLTTTRVDLARELGLPVDLIPAELVPRWNIAPSQPVAVLRHRDGVRLDLLQWGLIPTWADDPAIGNRLINARSETLSEKPSFRDSFLRRRCLVVADGFYEWAKPERGRTKTPFFIRMRSGGVFTFAGLWSRWRLPGRDEIESCAIVTGEPNDLVAPVHDRMPVILPPDRREAWMDPDHQDADSLRSLLRTFPENEMEMYAVGRHVNSPANDDPACIEPAGDEDTPPPRQGLLFD
jgi:putative SOS response-associated peptidase YedK